MAAQAHDNSEPAFFAHPPIPVKEYEAFREARPTNKGKLENFRNMGELSKALIARPNSYLSDHPQVAFVALGKYAKWITQSHPLSAQLGLDSPLGRCLELKSKIILIGVNYDNATGLHLGEHLSYKRPCILQGAKVLIHSEPTWVKFNAYDYDSMYGSWDTLMFKLVEVWINSVAYFLKIQKNYFTPTTFLVTS